MPGDDPTRRWIVDPLDGTTNFLHGLPHWAVSIALEHKGEIVAGVIYDPVKDEIFVAEKGAGAWLNDRRLRVSGRRDMIEMIFATGIPFGGQPELPRTLRELAALTPRLPASAAGARPRSTSPTSPPAASTATGSATSTPGTWRRASSSSARPAASSARSRAKATRSKAAASRPPTPTSTRPLRTILREA